MVSSKTKRVFAWLLAMMVALVVAPSMAFADVTAGTIEGGSTWEGEHDSEKDDVAWTDAATDEQKNETVLTVYTKIADEETITLTSFSRADLLSLAAENTQVLGYEYAVKTGASVFVTDKYVTFDQLMDKKLMKGMGKSQISVTPEDTLTVSDASGEYGKATFDKAFFDKEGKFFPSVKSVDGALDFSELGTPQDAPAVIALSWADGALEDGSAAGAVWNEVSPYFKGELRLFNGTTTEELTGEEAALPGGKFSPSGIIGITVKTPASNSFTVYSQDGADATPVMAKEYTRDTLEPLATDGAKGFLYFGSVWQVGVTTKSVPIETLLADAGLTLEENDTVVFAAPDGFKTTLTAAAIASERYFYPSAVGDQTDDSNPTEVGTVLALNWNAARPIETAGATMVELAEGSLSNQYRLFTGLSADNYANKVAAGNRFVTNPKTLTLIKGEKPSTVTLADKTVTYNGKTVAAAEAEVTGSTGEVTYAYYSDAACTKEIAAANVKNAGTYYVKASVAAKDNFGAATSKAAKITINRAKITDVALSATSFTYANKVQKPSVSSVKAGTLKLAASDYNITYSNASSKNAGSYKVTVAGTGNFTSSTSRSYKINQAASTVTLASKKVTYSAKAIVAAKASVKGSTGKVTYKYYSDAKCTKAIKAASVKNAGTYYVKASVAADANYKASTSKVAKIVINKKAQSISAKAKVAKAFAGKKSGKTTVLAATKTFSLKTLAKVSAKTNVKFAKANTAGGTLITVGKSTGKITVKKGLKKGSYKVKVKLTAAASTNFKAAAAKAVYVTVTVK